MVSKERKCGNCGKTYVTKMIKVFVFKKRICPKCNIEMVSYNGIRLHECSKCGLKVKFDDEKALGSMGVAMKGTSKDKKVMRKMVLKGFEIEKFLIPKKEYCQRCRNVVSIITNMIESEKKKANVRELTPEEGTQVLRKAVMTKLKEQHTELVAKRNKEMQEETVIKNAKNGKVEVKVTKEPKKGEFEGAMLTTPFNTPFNRVILNHRHLNKGCKCETKPKEKDEKK